MRHVYLVTLFVCVLLVSILGFRGSLFTAPPLDIFPEWAFPSMENQPKYRPQSASAFFADGRADRVPPARTVARGMLREDDHLHRGKDAAGGFTAGFPAGLTVDVAFLQHGRERYQIYCAPCHSPTGDGNGITKKYGMGATPTYHDPRLRGMPDGEIYNTITNGKNTMLPYADKLSPEERWAVVAYVRALQRAQQGTAADVTDTAAKSTLGLPMSSPAVTAPATIPVESTTSIAGRALVIGLIGTGLTAVGAFFDASGVAMSWLVGVTFWTAIAIGMLMLILIHHIFDASWSTVIRRQFEHGLAAFKWLGLLFAPLLLASFLLKRDLIWPWLNLGHELHGGHTVGHDPLYLKKAGFLSPEMLVGMTALFFVIWVWLSARLRKASFSQDADGDLRWTYMNRKSAAFGLPLGALTLTFAAIYWVKSLEYHWFSTMYGVWFFANCVRGALCIGVIIMVWLWNRGDYKGVLNTNHFHSIGMLMLAFTVFWAYVTFSQYFLIWNANVPEETFWYNLRELNHDGTTNQWWYIGLVILFGHFFVPFFALLSYRFKVTKHIIRRIAYWNLSIILIDICYNILPALKDSHGDAMPFLSLNLLWVLTSVVGVGGICVWAYLRSFPTTKLIPIRDPRIGESLTHHE